MDQLSQTQIDALRTALQDRRRQLLREIAEHQHGKQHVDTLIDQFNESGQDWDLAPIFRDIEHAESERDRSELSQVQDALYRIELGSIGWCIDCGEAIAHARLEAQPFASRCVKCQAGYEQRTGQAQHASL